MNEAEFNTFLNLCAEAELCDDKHDWTCGLHFPQDHPTEHLTQTCTDCKTRTIRDILLNPTLSTTQKIDATLHYLIIDNLSCFYNENKTLSELLKCDCQNGFPCLMIRVLRVVFENQSTWDKEQPPNPSSENKKEIP
ncbi:MAG: hypothetical protein LBH79_07455 [Nitrososphaerota archaeon]|jgi:hypothetical protein|nr:hypothetical protein [Nitrososphaerota archaeon]